MLEKEVKVICPKCGHVTTFKNYVSWIWHAPFHWFGKRRLQCAKCGTYSYVKAERA